MAWEALDRRTAVTEKDAPAVLNEAVREKIRSFFPRYETKRAALLPALHVVQDALGHVDWQAMREIAEVTHILPPQRFIQVVARLDAALNLRQHGLVGRKRSARRQVEQHKGKGHYQQQRRDAFERTSDDVAQHLSVPGARARTCNVRDCGP